ncbi:hypothetical protein PSAC2689_210068 [Paraburkholderia sacchari]
MRHCTRMARSTRAQCLAEILQQAASRFRLARTIRDGHKWGASWWRQPSRSKSGPLWAEGGQWGPKAALGDGGEALVGQTSSPGVRLSDGDTPSASMHSARPRCLLLHTPHPALAQRLPRASHSLTLECWTSSRLRF